MCHGTHWRRCRNWPPQVFLYSERTSGLIALDLGHEAIFALQVYSLGCFARSSDVTSMPASISSISNVDAEQGMYLNHP